MTASPTIDILMASYAGEGHIGEQIESILRQTFHNWRLIARDDGSPDRTQEILEHYRNRLPEKIILLPPGASRLGPCQNFGNLLAESRSDYLMLADQDDVWLPDKVENSFRRIRALEEQIGFETPILVHSDLRVVDANLRDIAASYWRYQHLNPETASRLNRLLMQNVVTGCTVIINRALKNMALPIPPEAIMHDWWLALVAAAFGRVDSIRHSTVLYRQHRENQIGVSSWNRYLGRNLAAALRGDELTAKLERIQRQGLAFFERYQRELPLAAKESLEAFISLEQKNFFEKRSMLMRHGFLKSGFLRNLGLLIRI